MKKSVILTVLIMSLSLVFFSFAKASKNTEALAAASRTKVVTDSSAIEEKTIEMKSEQIYQDLQLAESVRNWLSKHGISEERLSVHAMGEGNPEASNNTAEGKQLNRRVEIVALNTK